MGFDPKSETGKAVIAYLGQRQGLVIDSNSGSRNAARKVLSTLGVKSANVDVAENFSEGEEKLRKKKYEVVFAEINLGKGTGFDLIKIQKEIVANAFDSIFILFSDKNSPAVTSQIAESEADGMVLRPLNLATVQDKLSEVVQTRLNPSQYTQILQAGRTAMTGENFDDAISTFEKARALDPMPSLALYFEAQARLKKGDRAGALENLKAGLAVNPKHYKCLLGMLEIYFEDKNYPEAYSVGAQLTQNFPVSPNRVSNLIWLCVYMGKYADVSAYYDIFAAFEDTDPKVMTAISAGLVVMGKDLVKQGKNKESFDALKKAEMLGKTKPIIMKEVLMTMMRGGFMDESEKIFEKLNSDMKSTTELRLVDLEKLHLKNDGGTLPLAMGLMKENIVDYRLYEIAVLRSIEAKRKPENIAELIETAVKAFPNKKEDLERLKP